MGEARKDAFRVGFDNRLRIEFHGTKVSTDGGLFPYRELDVAVPCGFIGRPKHGRRGHMGNVGL